MKRPEKRMRKDLEHQKEHSQTKLLKKASKLRKSSRLPDANQPRLDEKNWEERADDLPTRSRKTRRSSLDEVARDLTNSGEKRDEGSADQDAADVGLVIAIDRAGATIVQADQTARTNSIPTLAVGDRVLVRKLAGHGFRLAEILPRATTLSRPDPHIEGRERVIAANVDIVVHVVSIRTPPLRPGLIDRYLMAIRHGGARPVICVNKIDLASDRNLEMKSLEPFQRMGIPVIPCSTVTGHGIAALREQLEGCLAVLVGHSGVGKSSVLNALEPRLILRTGQVSEGRGTGRHTTTSSVLYQLGKGTAIIDTPGVREFGLWGIDRESLAAEFPEVATVALRCRFRDCTHSHEPNCAVKAALDAGDIDRPRFESYLRLLEEVT